MITRISVASIILVVANINVGNSQQYLGDTFKYERSFSLDTSKQYGEISSFSVMNDSMFVILDHVQGRIDVISDKGRVVRSVNPAQCHPGFQMQPIQVQVLQNGELFFTNSGYQGFRYKANGDCIGLPHDSFRAPDFISPTMYEGFVSQYKRVEQVLFVSMDNSGKAIDTLLVHDYNFKNLDYRLMNGGHVLTNTQLFFVYPSSIALYRYDGIKTSIHKPRITDAMVISRDISSSRNMVEIRDVFKTKSLSISLHAISNSRIVQVVSIPSQDQKVLYAWVVYDQNGQVLDTSIRTNHFLLGARNGRLFVLETRNLRTDPEFHVHIYRYNSSSP